MQDKMCKITFQPSGTVINVPLDTTVLKAAIDGRVPLEGPCNGKGTCGKCLVKAAGSLSAPTPQESKILGQQLEEGWRLACQTRLTGDTEVRLNAGKSFNTILKGYSEKYPLNPPAAQWFSKQEELFGIAVDIGTTSIVACLVDLKNGAELAVSGGLNPQTVFGGDVLTRINFAHERRENVNRLKTEVVDGINHLIDNVCNKAHIKSNDIFHIVVAANTTMLHMLIGIDPFSLAVAPYTPVFTDYRELKAADAGLKTHRDAILSLLPALSAFVGADILAGVLATGFHKVPEPALFIDIGTNGEIVANVNGHLAATSSAAGPALEGMNIHHGCRAEQGAIAEAEISLQGSLVTRTIGGSRAIGICGSGLIDLIAVLVRTGVILESGRFNDQSALPENLAQRMTEFNGQKAFLVDANEKILLTQGDIRQVQLAKGAIAAAIDILFKRLGTDLKSVKKLYVAGAFGFHLKPGALKTIGLIPPGLEAEILFVGNTAKEGAKMCLISRAACEDILLLQHKIQPLELSYAPEFQDYFVEHLEFPTVQEAAL